MSDDWEGLMDIGQEFAEIFDRMAFCIYRLSKYLHILSNCQHQLLQWNFVVFAMSHNLDIRYHKMNIQLYLNLQGEYKGDLLASTLTVETITKTSGGDVKCIANFKSSTATHDLSSTTKFVVHCKFYK
jgi:hypothetical protein